MSIESLRNSEAAAISEFDQIHAQFCNLVKEYVLNAPDEARPLSWLMGEPECIGDLGTLSERFPLAHKAGILKGIFWMGALTVFTRALTDAAEDISKDAPDA